MTKVVANPEVTAVALASLVKLVRLLGAELVAGSHRDDIDVFEKCVREKLHANVTGVSAEATAAGVALAHSLVEPILRTLRVQAQEAASPQSISQQESAPPAHKLH
jgi:hypothetical protein